MNDSTPPPGGQDPSGPAAPGPRSDRGGSAPGSGFFAWLRGLGIVRGDERWFSGVAGGIAVRAGIDPLIVRGLFVVLAVLGGPGLLLYLAGWLLLPDSSGRIHAEEIVRGRAQTGVIVAAAIIAGVVVVPVVFGFVLGGAPLLGTPSFWGWDLWTAMGIPVWLMRTVAWIFWIGVIVVCAVLVRRFILQRGRESMRSSDSARDPDAGAAASTAEASAGSYAQAQPREQAQTPPRAQAFGAEAPSSGTEAPAPGTGADAPHDQRPAPGFAEQTRAFADRAERFAAQTGEKAQDWSGKAAAWGDEVGRKADDWSARYAEHHDARRLGAGQVVLTLALALIAAGGAAIWALGDGGALSADSAAPAPLVAALIAATAVLALSLIVAGVRGRHTGWVGFLAACGVVALLMTTVLPWGTRLHPFGNASVENGDPGLVMFAGSSRIDLDRLDLDRLGSAGAGASDASDGSDASGASDDAADAGAADREIAVWQFFGNSTVVLPDDRPVELKVRVLAGNIDERGGDGRRVSGPLISRTVHSPAGEHAAADLTTVTVYLGAGNVRIVQPTTGGEGSDSAPDPEDSSRIREIRDGLDRIDWQLQEPGLDSGVERDLERERDELLSELDELEGAAAADTDSRGADTRGARSSEQEAAR